MRKYVNQIMGIRTMHIKICMNIKVNVLFYKAMNIHTTNIQYMNIYKVFASHLPVHLRASTFVQSLFR